MIDEGPFPPALPAVVPSPIGPAISYSNIRAITSRAQSLIDQLDKKIRKPIHNGLDAAGNAGAKLESKVLSRLADQLNPVEQLHSDTVDLIKNQLAANMAPAVVTLEDMTSADSQASQSSTVAPARKQAVASAAASQPSVVAAPAPQSTTRAVSLTGGGVSPTFFGPLIGENNPGLNPPGACTMIDEATWKTLQKGAQTIADQACAGGPPAGEDYVGNWWRCTEDCCVTGPVRSPNDNPTPPVAKYFDFAIDGYASCVAKGFAWFLTQWDPKGLTCGSQIKPPVDCTKTPLDPSCPPNCFVHPEDPRCPPGTCPPPCIDVTCPPPVINIPPCPPLNLPTCIQIDLCDWDKFCKALKDCLTQSKEDCSLDNEEAYVLDDCQGQLGQAQKLFFAETADQITNASTVQDAVKPSSLQNNQFVQVFRVGRDLFQDLTPA